jgi:hypothetical protein
MTKRAGRIETTERNRKNNFMVASMTLTTKITKGTKVSEI